MRKYMKRKEKFNALNETTDELISRKASRRALRTRAKVLLASLVIIPVACLFFAKDAECVSQEVGMPINMAVAPVAATAVKKDVITIPSGTVKAHPFLPYRDIGGTAISDVPSYDLIEPPEMIDSAAEATRIMNTVVSGILYDKYSPSAILNIEGNDYLVKKGDVVNNYKVVSIMQDSVTVKLGNNTFKAGIGEILTEGTINHNDVSNLDTKFGGDR